MEPNYIVDHNKNLVQCLPPMSVLNKYTFKEKLARLIIDGNIVRNKETELIALSPQ